MVIGSTRIHKKTVPSSFDYVKEHVSTFSDGTVVLCDHIENARGRDGRKWHVDQGQVLLTILLKPSHFSPSESNSLAMALSCGLLEGFSGFSASFKWPNDIMIAGKKVAGMLLEPVWHGARLEGVVVGIGINLNNHFDRTHELFHIATSIRDVSGAECNQEIFVDTVLQSLDLWYECYLQKMHDDIYARWVSFQSVYRKKIIVHTSSGATLEGVVERFLPHGGIELFVPAENKNVVIPFYITTSISMV